MQPVTLYELADARAILDEWLAETEGEVTPEIEALLEQLEGDAAEKVERVGLYIREQLVTAAAVEEEEQRLVARRKSLERGAEGLKSYLQRQLERLGKTKVEGLRCTVALQKNSQPVVQLSVTPETLYEHDRRFVQRVERVEFVFDRAAAIEQWKQGLSLPAGVAISVGHHVRIR